MEEIENIFDEVIFLKDGTIILHENVEEIRFHHGKAVHELFREVFEQ
ncbi:ABC transporter ATP-binding protein [Bacillus thuringiensis]|nr:ABC transporter ATP-binding protein [Bacillus thuringiensis]